MSTRRVLTMTTVQYAWTAASTSVSSDLVLPLVVSRGCVYMLVVVIDAGSQLQQLLNAETAIGRKIE